MAIVLNTTPGDAAFNSFASLAEALAYHETRLFSSWEDFDDEEKKAALVQATRTLIYGFSWVESGIYSPQLLAMIPTAFPLLLKQATSELAMQMLKTDRAADNDVQREGLSGVVAGPVELSFRESAVKENLYRVIPDEVRRLLSIYITQWFPIYPVKVF